MQNRANNLSDMLSLLDTVDQMRHKDGELAVIADTVSYARELRERLISHYQKNGLSVSNEMIAKAIQMKLDSRFVFQEPEHNLSYRLATAYVNRAKAYPALGFIISLIIAASGALYGINDYHARQHRAEVAQIKHDEHQAQLTVEGQTQRADQLRKKVEGLTALAGPASGWDAAEKAKMVTKLDLVGEKNQEVLRHNPFPALNDHVSGTTLKAVKGKLQALNTGLVSRNEQVLGQAKRYLTERSALKHLTAEYNHLSAAAAGAHWPGALKGVIQNHLGDAQSSLSEGDVAGTRQALASVQRSKQEYALAQTALKRAEQTVSGDQSLSLTKDAKSALNQALKGVKAAFSSGDYASASGQALALEHLSKKIRTGYRLMVVDQSGVKSGVWRYYRNRNNRSYYLVVQAINDQGKVLTLPIRDQENGRTTETKRFAVQVSRAQYEAVKRDKLDDGIIQHKLVGIKRPGALHPKYKMDVVGGDITHW